MLSIAQFQAFVKENAFIILIIRRIPETEAHRPENLFRAAALYF